MGSINLPANLPENLEWDQIIAPNGADIGMPEQYGYNYLLRQVNATQWAFNTMAKLFGLLPVVESDMDNPYFGLMTIDCGDFADTEDGWVIDAMEDDGRIIDCGNFGDKGFLENIGITGIQSGTVLDGGTF